MKLAEFDQYMLTQGVGELTRTAHRARIKDFREYTQKDNPDYSDVLNYLTQKHEIISVNTVFHYAVSLKKYYEFLELMGEKSISPKLIKIPKRKEAKREFFTSAEIQKILKNTNSKTLLEARYRAMILTLYSSGMRASEVCSLMRSQFDGSGEFRITGKGGKQGLVFISSQAVEAIEKYLAKRKDDSPALFVSTRGVPMNRRKLYKDVKKILSRCGIKKKAFTHTFRHSFATHLLQNGVNMREIQRLLRHTNINTTMVYTHVVDSTLKKTHNLLFNK